MITLSARRFKFNILTERLLESTPNNIYPYFREHNGDFVIWLISPQHGRSYLVGINEDGRYIISKGNGLSYTDKLWLNLNEQNKDVMGLLLEEDALRDYTLGNEIAALGILTNRMEAVIELEKDIIIKNEYIRPILLQYSVECPYRISDAAFMRPRQIIEYVDKWKNLDKWNCNKNYEIAAHILISNLRTLHDNGILHNALTSQNLTWALELLDFELAYSPSVPYSSEDYNRHVPDLFEREILHTYQIILDIAWILREIPDYEYIDGLFFNYGFKI